MVKPEEVMVITEKTRVAEVVQKFPNSRRIPRSNGAGLVGHRAVASDEPVTHGAGKGFGGAGSRVAAAHPEINLKQ